MLINSELLVERMDKSAFLGQVLERSGSDASSHRNHTCSAYGVSGTISNGGESLVSLMHLEPWASDLAVKAVFYANVCPWSVRYDIIFEWEG
jgi:hypothetical protein